MGKQVNLLLLHEALIAYGPWVLVGLGSQPLMQLTLRLFTPAPPSPPVMLTSSLSISPSLTGGFSRGEGAWRVSCQSCHAPGFPCCVGLPVDEFSKTYNFVGKCVDEPI